MKYLKFLSLAAIIVAVAGAGVKLYTDSKSQQQISQTRHLYDSTLITMKRKVFPVDSAKKITIETFANITKGGKEETNTAEITLWAKIIFSGLFCIAALIVVLSNKYNDETKKWAFSVLTLVAGVWIGSATS